MKNNTRKIIAFILAFTMLFAMTAITTSAASDTKTYYFSNNKGWESVYVHYWDASQNNNGWPGTKATFVGTNGYNEGVYSIEVPASTKGIVFTAGENGPQTVDIILAEHTDDGFYLTNEVNGKWEIGTYQFSPDGVTGGDIDPGAGDSGEANANLERDVTLVLKNTAGWESVHVYYWAIGETNPDWPGEQIAPDKDGLYYAVIPAGNYYVIFNNGETGEALVQTADMVVPTDDNVLYDNGSDTWSEMRLAANHPEDGKGGMTFLQKAAKALLICLRTVELFFKNIGGWFTNLFGGNK